MALRRALHARGLRYRVDQPLPGLPRRRSDLTFSRQRVVVFFDGCFWHGCPEHRTDPKTNRAWWSAKRRANVQRDRETEAHLADLGWTSIRVWEHEESALAVQRIVEVLQAATPADNDLV